MTLGGSRQHSTDEPVTTCGMLNNSQQPQHNSGPDRVSAYLLSNGDHTSIWRVLMPLLTVLRFHEGHWLRRLGLIGRTWTVDDSNRGAMIAAVC